MLEFSDSLLFRILRQCIGGAARSILLGIEPKRNELPDEEKALNSSGPIGRTLCDVLTIALFL